MPTRDQNLEVWNGYDWSRGGEEWSEVWGGVRAQWWGCLFPRLSRFLSAPTILEIAPGVGRFSHFLAPLAERLILVDSASRCVDACRQRFASLPHVECHLNDGGSLPFLGDRSVDFAFSFDSLVHVDLPTIASCLRELARVLAPDGVAFLHHSNFGEYVDEATGSSRIPNAHWRDAGVTAERVRAIAEQHGLVPVAQELVNWGAGEELIDCLSLLARRGSRHESAPRVARNPRFMEEATGLARLFALWDPDGPDYERALRSGAPPSG